jgi:ribosomal protein L12E/L44/L45/RPP1/RPP2
MRKLGEQWKQLSTERQQEWNEKAHALNTANGLSTPIKKTKKADTPATPTPAALAPAPSSSDDDEEEKAEEEEEEDDEEEE